MLLDQCTTTLTIVPNILPYTNHFRLKIYSFDVLIYLDIINSENWQASQAFVKCCYGKLDFWVGILLLQVTQHIYKVNKAVISESCFFLFLLPEILCYIYL